MMHLEPIRDKAQLDALVRAAAADHHAVLFPTHLVVKGAALAGYASVCATPIVHVWLDSARVQAVDTVHALASLDNLLRSQGVAQYVMPCAETSPLYPSMGKLGFAKLFNSTLHLRTLGAWRPEPPLEPVAPQPD